MLIKDITMAESTTDNIDKEGGFMAVNEEENGGDLR
jgi:hypothetical protein